MVPPTPSASAPPATTSDVEALVRAAQYEMVVDRSRSANLIGTPFAAVVVWLLWDSVDPGRLLGWLALKGLCSLARIAITRAFDRERATGSLRWGRRFVWAIAADGAVFGLLGTLLLPVHDVALSAVMVATLIGIAAIGLVVLSPSLQAALAHTIPTLLPAAAMQFLRGDTLSTYIGIGMMVFLGLTVLEGRRAAAHTRDMLRLRFRMDELAAQRQQALDEAKRSSAVKGQFLATMSHELRTPLHGMLGLTRLMRREGAAGSAAADRLEVMERTGEHLLNVINEVLEHSRLDGGHLKLRPLPFDPRALIDSVAGLMRPSALEKGLALTLVDRLPPGLHLVGDAHRVRQVLLNLAGNALKFTDHGSVTIEAQLDAGRRLCIDVSDTGPGVAPAERERIFEAFRQLDGSFSRRHGGSGLGLTISRQLVEAMGGTIECRDAPGGGACFSVGLPLPTAAAPAPGMPPPPHRHSLSGRVLLVEDNPVNAMVAQETLRILGLEVVTVAGGEQAVACATQDRFDLILMDCQMPGVDGFEATSRIRRHERGTGADRVPIVALTANALLGDRERSLAAGMDDHIAKPFRDDDLIRVLGRLLPEVGSAAEA